MKKLAPNLFDRRFDDFVDLGRARLRSLAPDWTDHNAHDPGITLMELLAWVAEAQLWSLSRVRRDERVAYAALLGLAPSGTQSATGLIWSDRLDLTSPIRTFAKTALLSENTVINVVGVETTTFRPADKLLWVPGRIASLVTRMGDGLTTDHTTTNEHGNTPFLPFGAMAGHRDVLAVKFVCRDDRGLFGNNPQSARLGARWAIGVRVAPPLGGAGIETAESVQTNWTPLEATLVVDDTRVPLKIASDSTQGLLATGTLLLDLDHITDSPGEFTIELRSLNGFPRPPRLLHIEPNVIPIWQGRTISREPHEAKGLPDWSFTLESLGPSGLRFARGEEPLTLQVAEPTGERTWRRHDRLSEQGPQDHVYELDTKTGEVRFGNGVNGRIPPAGSQVFVTYTVSDGEMGAVARNRKWKVAGFEGVFGVNLDPIMGGSSPSGWIGARREARHRSRDAYALVSADDIVAAAQELPLLEVARVWVPKPDERAPRTAVVTLVAMRSRPKANEPENIPETRRWLEAIRRRLIGRMSLGTRLVVVAPRYMEFSIQALLEVHQGRDPEVVKQNVEEELQKRLALIDSGMGVPLRQPGVPVTQRDLAAWVRAADGVRRVSKPQLIRADGRAVDKLHVPRNGLPRLNFKNSIIEVKRVAMGGIP